MLKIIDSLTPYFPHLVVASATIHCTLVASRYRSMKLIVLPIMYFELK
jgi:hypothetical protein